MSAVADNFDDNFRSAVSAPHQFRARHAGPVRGAAGRAAPRVKLQRHSQGLPMHGR